MLVALATHNGGEWLSFQLQSLLAQEDADWHLLVSDDQSSDGTRDLLQAFSARDSRIELLPPRTGALGACANFEYLLGVVRERDSTGRELVALCDQDDVWRVDKLASNRGALAQHLGCCSELDLMSADGQLTGERLLKQLNGPTRLDTSTLLAQNAAVGCTMAFQSRVLELALPFPPGLLNHDWWLAMCICSLGELQFIPDPLVHYRQHRGNVVGAYRPLRQILRLPTLIARQRSVLRSQRLAVMVLKERLLQLGLETPPDLDSYHHALGAPSLTRVRSLLGGPFAAPHFPLRALRGLAALRTLN